MNKNSKFLFVGLTLILLFISIGAISATDINDTTTISDDNTNSQNIISSKDITSQKIETTTTKDVKKTTNKQAKKVKQADKQTKKEGETLIQTVKDYNELKDAWNYIQTNGDNTTQYTINVKNGEYKFEDEIKSEATTDTRYITLNGENISQTIFDGTNTTRLFNLNNTKQVIKFNNITFKNGNSTEGGAIRANSTTILNNTQFINNNVFNTNASANGGAIKINYNTQIYNSKFINNTATSTAGYACGGAIILVKIQQFITVIS